MDTNPMDISYTNPNIDITNLGISSVSAYEFAATDISLCTFVLQQRQCASRFNKPQSRLVLTTSPYPTYTKQQLDMRRKTEILQYKNNQTNSKTNNLTKKQMYSQLTNPASSNLSQYRIANCPNQIVVADKTKPSWSTGCDVPYPPILLTYDPSIPLYNYAATFQRVYSYLPPNNQPFYLYYTLLDKLQNISIPLKDANNEITNTTTIQFVLGHVVFTRYVENNPLYSIPRITIPIGFSIQGTRNTIPWNKSISKLQFTLDNQLQIQWKFSGDMNPIYGTMTLNNMLSSIVFDLSSNLMMNQTIQMQCYIGVVTIPSFFVTSGPQTVFNIYGLLNYTYDKTRINTYFSNFQVNLLSNIEESIGNNTLYPNNNIPYQSSSFTLYDP